MSKKHELCCAWCREPLGLRGGFILSVEGPSGEKVRMGWHVEGRTCADDDPLQAAMADAVGLPDGPDADAACRLAYLAIRDRAATYGADALRHVVDVRSDFTMGPRTLRGPGLRWGREWVRR